MQFNNKFAFMQYWELFTINYTYFIYFWNSFFYAAVTTIVCIAISLPLGILFSKIKFKGSGIFFTVIIIVMLMPFQATLLPNYIQLREFSLINTRWSLLLPMFFSPLAVVMLKQFIEKIPQELFDYSYIETSSVINIIRFVILPSIYPAISTLAVLLFCDNWNMVEQPLIFIPENDQLLPLSLKLIELPQNVKFAGAIVYMVPILLLLLITKETIKKFMEDI
jgi:multiple sugar transport system permease protein